MNNFEISEYREGAGRNCQDEFGYWDNDKLLFLVFADGAGGLLDGGSASKELVKAIGKSFGTTGIISYKAELKSMDSMIAVGETTGIVVSLNDKLVNGASVGDSKAMILINDEFIELTANQNRKPLIGSGYSNPVEFSASYNGELIIIGTDGFWNYCKLESILPVIYFTDFAILAKKLSDLCRLNSGKLNDDIAILCIRKRKIRKSINY